MSIRHPIVIAAAVVATTLVTVVATVIAYNLIHVPTAEEELLQYAMSGRIHRVYGDLRDGILGPPDDPEQLAHYERFGITREMLEDPSIMTQTDVRNLENALNAVIAEHWEDFQAMMSYAGSHQGIPPGSTGVATAAYEGENGQVYVTRVEFGPFAITGSGFWTQDLPE